MLRRLVLSQSKAGSSCGDGDRVIENADTLQTISELAAAFAGFAALVSALSGRGRSRSVIDATRLHIAVAGSLIAVLGGLIPTIVAAHFPTSSHVWRVSAAAVLSLNYGYGFAYRGWIKRLRGDLPQEGLSARTLFWTLEGLVQLALIACIAGLGNPASFYLSALGLLLAQAALVFLGLVTSLAESVTED
jgi:hypothetical protein